MLIYHRWPQLQNAATTFSEVFNSHNLEPGTYDILVCILALCMYKMWLCTSTCVSIYMCVYV